MKNISRLLFKNACLTSLSYLYSLTFPIIRMLKNRIDIRSAAGGSDKITKILNLIVVSFNIIVYNFTNWNVIRLPNLNFQLLLHNEYLRGSL